MVQNTDTTADAVATIVASVQTAAKYRNLCPDTIRRVAAAEWRAQRTLKQAIKSTKTRLHQAYGAYESQIDYERAWRDLCAAHSTAGHDRAAILSVARGLLSRHASTKERLPILDRFFDRVFAHTGAPHTLLDLACGLNPLARPWMRLDAEAVYHAYDIDAARIDFIDRYFTLTHTRGSAHLQDILCHPPIERADVALLLKSSACLERQKKGSTLALLDRLNVAQVIVSFPVKSLGRREKGMAAHYARTFTAMLAGRPWPVTRLDFATEMAFIVDKRGR